MRDNKIKQIIRETVNDVLTESSLNRVLLWMNNHDIACITACRNELKNATPRTLDDRPKEVKGNGEETPYKYNSSEIRERNRQLKASLLSLGYGVTNIRGNYIENFGTIDAIEVGESSFFVVNLKDDPNFKENIFTLSEYYNQDSFLYKPKGSDNAYIIGTNFGEYPGYKNEENVGKLHINIDNEFLSRVGNRSFAFTPDEDVRHDNRDYNFRTRKQNRTDEIKELLGLELYEDYSRGSRMSIKTIYNKTRKNIMEMQNK